MHPASCCPRWCAAGQPGQHHGLGTATAAASGQLGRLHHPSCSPLFRSGHHSHITPHPSRRSLPLQILICQNLRNNLQHPNEYIRGVTLRFLCRIHEEELLEPLVPSGGWTRVHCVCMLAGWRGSGC